jgi:hypothetical protein
MESFLWSCYIGCRSSSGDVGDAFIDARQNAEAAL